MAIASSGGIGIIGAIIAFLLTRDQAEPSEQVEVIRAAGTSEARTCLVYGFSAGLLPLCAGVALVGLGVVRLRSSGTGI